MVETLQQLNLSPQVGREGGKEGGGMGGGERERWRDDGRVGGWILEQSLLAGVKYYYK